MYFFNFYEEASEPDADAVLALFYGLVSLQSLPCTVVPGVT